MKLSSTLWFIDVKAHAAGTQATVPDSRSADSWIKKYLDDKNKRLNDLRVQMNTLLGPGKGEVHGEGTSEGASKGWDERGRGRKGQTGENRGRRATDKIGSLITGTGWYANGQFYPLQDGEEHMRAAIRLGLANAHAVYSDMFQKPNVVRVRIYNYGVADLETGKKEYLKDALAALPREVNTVNMEWWYPRVVTTGRMSKEEAIDLYAAWRMDKPPISEQDPKKVAGGGNWAVTSSEGEIISTWQTEEEANNAAYVYWHGIIPSSTGATGGARVKKLQAVDVFSDPNLMEQGRKKFIKHEKPNVVKLADWLRDGDHRPSSAGSTRSL